MATTSDPRRPRSVVLVHGTWSGPHDWRWVTELLEQAGVRVLAVDLPSHSSADAGLLEDGEAVRAAIRACEPPVVVAGWSSGGESMDLGAEGEPDVARLVYVACYPSPPRNESDVSTAWIDDDPLLRRVGDGTFVLDTDLWLDAESHLFDATLLAHFREHRRRPVSLLAMTETTTGRAWTTTPFTVLLGRNDPLIPVEGAVAEATGVTEEVLHVAPDIRIIDCDHFIIFRHPDVVRDLILEPLP
jgi:pimeloyl-ACP methyl ester carboxylesterase